MMKHDPGITRKQKGLVIVNTGDGKEKQLLPWGLSCVPGDADFGSA
jgi:ATP:corrinoid adenosyltransferase